jgi:hypothetical protein
MRAFLPIVALAAVALLASSCTSTDDTKIAEITVAAYLTPCAAYEILDCMVVDDGSGRPDLYDSIDGFVYHWGSTYRLDVEIEKILNPPPDGESREVRLRTIIDVQPVAARSTFTLALHGVPSVNSPPLLATNGQGFAMASGRQIVCDDPADEAAPLIAVAVAPR